MPLRILVLVGLLLSFGAEASGQSDIPRDIRGDEDMIARGILDGNLIQTNFRNHGEASRWNDLPWGIWPRGIGDRHLDGIGVMVAGRVVGERAKWPFYGGKPDTLVNPVILTYREAGTTTGPSGERWGWLPLPGFHNTARRNALGDLEPVPALSDDASSWPDDWPDRRGNPDDPGWPGQWNGFFGKGVFSADLESYYVIDDHSDMEYSVDPETGRPLSNFGVFYPSPSDSTMGGLGLQTAVRIFQWANVLAEDVMFLLYRITNAGETVYAPNPGLPEDSPDEVGLWFSQLMDYGLGWEEGDELSRFDAQLDVVFGWDIDGVGTNATGGQYDLGYTGFAFLESPAREGDGRDDDGDGITDELRFGGPGILIEGQDEIRAFVEANYDLAAFEAFDGPLEERAAFQAGYWWTGDENLDWRTFEDKNDDGVWDPNTEFVNNDVGLDGLGPLDLGYPGPDTGEGNGIPDAGEPNFDETDVDESDQIGLTGFDLNDRPFYENADNLRTDTWLFERIKEFAEPNINISQGIKEGQEGDRAEPFILFTSGPVGLEPNTTTFFSTAWIFGADEADFFKNRRTVQSIYDADYSFAQPPFTPSLTAVPGDGRVVLTWDTVSVASFDRFTQEQDFEGFRLYKGTDPLISDARTITDVDGIPTFFKPIAQWDLVNGIRGPVPVFEGAASYNLGGDTGLAFSYIDEDVTNGIPYYYALVAYDRGVIDSVSAKVEIDPQENVFNVSTDLAGNVVGVSQNAAVVVPRSLPAGFVGGQANEDLTQVTGGIGTGEIAVRILVDELVKPDTVYKVTFYSEPLEGTELYNTVAFDVFNVTANEQMLPRTSLVETTPMVDGFVIDIDNDEVVRNVEGVVASIVEYDTPNLGYVGDEGTAQETFSLDPTLLEGYTTNWLASVALGDATGSALFAPSVDDFELRWVNPADSTYRPVRFGSFLRAEIPVFAFNYSQGTRADLFIEDTNRNSEFDAGDVLIIYERDGVFRKFRHRVTFQLPEGTTESIPPSPGNKLRVSVEREFANNDFFQFTLSKASIDADKAKSELEDISVVPNPYVGASEFEPRSQIAGRGERRIQFINLPQKCTINIFNLRGELVQTIEHDGTGSDGSEFWNLRTRDEQDAAYGVYVYHVKADGIGEHVGKFALVK